MQKIPCAGCSKFCAGWIKPLKDPVYEQVPQETGRKNEMAVTSQDGSAALNSSLSDLRK